YLAQERRPLEREKGADAADGEGQQHTDGKDEARGDDAQAMAYGLQREAVEPRAEPLRRPAKQPLDAKTQSDKHDEQQQRPGTSCTSQLRANQAGAPLELTRYIG